jgi:hypothetical protein
MIEELSLQGKIYVVCQLLYFLIILIGLRVVISILNEIKDEIKKRGP